MNFLYWLQRQYIFDPKHLSLRNKTSLMKTFIFWVVASISARTRWPCLLTYSLTEIEGSFGYFRINKDKINKYLKKTEKGWKKAEQSKINLNYFNEGCSLFGNNKLFGNNILCIAHSVIYSLHRLCPISFDLHLFSCRDFKIRWWNLKVFKKI